MYQNKRLTFFIVWLLLGFMITTYYNACSNVSFDKSATLTSQSVYVKATSKVDILVVMDNSGSMAQEMSSMALRFSSFTDKISSLDWQLGIITTDPRSTVSNGDGRLIPLVGVSNQYILNPLNGLTTAQQIFSNTIQMPTNGSGTESGLGTLIAALNRSKSNSTENVPNKQLLRSDAALSVVIVSDTGDSSAAAPQDVISTMKNLYPDKTFVVNSLVVPESIYTGMTANNNDPCKNYRESTSKDGREYHLLSELTGGIEGTVCTNDYSSQLSDIGAVTASLVNSITLDCQPSDSNKDGKIDAKDIQIVAPNGSEITGFELSGRLVTFNQYLPLGKNEIHYFCML